MANGLLRALFDALLYPFQGLPPIVGLAAVSVLTAVAMLLVFKTTSDQDRLAQVKRQIHAGLLEIRLFGDDLGAVLRAQAEILRHNLTYLRLSLVPLLWMLLPVSLVLVHLHFHYGYRGLQPGDTAVVVARFREGGVVATGAGGGSTTRALPPGWAGVALEVPAGLRVETPPVRAPALREVAWRIAADRPGTYRIHVRLGGGRYAKEVRVSEAVVRLSPRRPPSGVLDQLLYPAEPPLPAGAPVESISLRYPDRQVSLLGWETHWLVVFFVLTVAAALVLRRPLGVVV